MRTKALWLALPIAVITQTGAAEPVWPPTAQYQGVAQMRQETGEMVDASVRASGAKMRLDFPKAVTGDDPAFALIFDFAAQTGLMFPVGDGVAADERIAMAASSSQISMQYGGVGYPDLSAAAHLGDITIESETCANYAITGQTPTGMIETTLHCLTADGILLQQAEADGTVVYTVRNVMRLPQPDALFSAPAGYEVFDMGALDGMLGMGDAL